MKKFKFVALLFVMLATCVGFASCGDDDDDDVAGTPLVGTWVGTGAEGYVTGDTMTMTLTADGKMIVTGVSIDHPNEKWGFKGTYKVRTTGSENIYLISFSGYFDGEDEFYEDDIDFEKCYLNGDKLTISFDGSDWTLTRQK